MTCWCNLLFYSMLSWLCKWTFKFSVCAVTVCDLWSWVSSMALWNIRTLSWRGSICRNLLIGLHCLVYIAKHLLSKPCEWLCCCWLLQFSFAGWEHKDCDCYPRSLSHTLLPIALGGLVTMESTICSLPAAGMWLSLLGWEHRVSRGARVVSDYLQCTGLLGFHSAHCKNKWRELFSSHFWLVITRNKSAFLR